MADLIRIFDEKLKKSAFLRTAAVKADLPEGKNKRAVCRLYRARGYCALFVFSFRGAAPGVRNLLECRIYEKENDLLYIPLSKLTGVITEGYRYLEYPYIATEEQMAEATDELLAALEELDPAITAFFNDTEPKTALYNELVREVNLYCGEEVLDYTGRVTVKHGEAEAAAVSKMLKFFYAMRISNHFAGPFAEFFHGRPHLALRGLLSNRHPDGETLRIVTLSPEQIAVSDLQKRLFKLAKRQSGVMLLPAMTLSALGCGLLAGPLLALLCALIYYFGAGGSDPSIVLHTALDSSRLFFFLLPLIMGGVLWLCFDEKPIFFLLYGRKRYKDYAEALHSPLERRASGVVGSLLLSALLVLSLLGGRYGVAFKEDYFSKPTAFFSLESINYTYDKIECAAVVGEGNDSLFLLILKDGQTISAGAVEGHSAPIDLLEERGIKTERYADTQELYAAFPHLKPAEAEDQKKDAD